MTRLGEGSPWVRKRLAGFAAGITSLQGAGAEVLCADSRDNARDLSYDAVAGGGD